MSTRSHFHFSKHLRHSTALIALLAAATQAPQALAQQQAQAPAVAEEIVVTGSRIVRDGFEAPTPVSVLSADALDAIAEPNIADAVNRLPALEKSLGTTNASTNVSSGTGGVNQLNLRALSAVRTLVLLDGKRVVGATLAGFENNGSVPDINNFPGGLVERVDVVTGGASAVYGSDALAGVVNFVLDKDFTGIKGEVMGGVTTYGDNEEYKIELTYGTPFAGGRGHFLLFGEHNYTAGVKGDGNRPYNRPENHLGAVQNPAYTPGSGLPRWILSDQIGLGVATAGGLIRGDNVNGLNAGPLSGIQFLAGGKQAPFEFGTFAPGSSFMIGGDFDQTNIWAWPTLNLTTSRTNVFSRVSYDLTDNFSVYGEASWGFTEARNDSVVPLFRFGESIRVDNAFLPDNIRQTMVDNGISSITVGSFVANSNREAITTASGETPLNIKAFNQRYLRRYVGGFEGSFDAFNTGWSWDAYYARSMTHNSTRSPDNLIPSRFRQAIDAVVHPTTGATVCRINADANPANDNPNCLPFNFLGTHVNGIDETRWITGTDYALTILSQDVMAASITGSPFSTWAGEVSVAFGGEHRIEKVRGIDSELGRTAQFFAGNYIATNAKWSVTEGFVETVVPLARGTEWAESLEFNGAVRYADYSESGGEVTWKAGLVYTPVDDITFRATRSRDIRAPNLGDLFNAGRAGTGQIRDPFQPDANGNPKVLPDVVSADVGNPNLEPERADTTGLGVVYRPSWFPGFTASADYYRINIKGAISIVDDQALVDGCFAGVVAFCGAIDRIGGGNGNNVTGDISFVRASPQNVLSQLNDGLDIEFAYTTPLDALVSDWEGAITMRGMLGYVFNLNTENTDPVTGAVTLFKGAGINADGGAGIPIGVNLVTPDLNWDLAFSYALDRFTGTVTWRGTGSGTYRNDFIVCQTSCPDSTTAAPTINRNHIESVSYIDMAATYDFLDNATAFLTIKNVMNRNPPIIATSSFFGGLDNDNYDRIGRTFRAGVRFRM